MRCHASSRHRPYQMIGENRVSDAHRPVSCPDGTDEDDDKKPSHHTLQSDSRWSTPPTPREASTASRGLAAPNGFLLLLVLLLVMH